MRPAVSRRAAALAAALAALAVSGPVRAQTSPSTGWLLLSNHNHSHASNDYSHEPDHDPGYEAFNSSGIDALGAAARQHNIDALVLTDHNTIRGCHDKAFGGQGRLWLCGEELTAGSAHSTVIFADVPPLLAGGAEPYHPYHLLKGFCSSKGCVQHRAGSGWNLPAEALTAMIERFQRRGGFAIVNHPVAGLDPLLLAGLTAQPEQRTYASWSWPYRSTLGAEGVEVGLPIASRQASALKYWDQQLKRGVRLTGMAGTDHHVGGFLEGRFTGVDRWVLALPVDGDSSKAPVEARRKALIEALGRGQVQVLARADIPTRVQLSLSTGVARYQIGDTIDTSRPGHSTGVLKVQITQPRGGKLTLIRNGKPWGAPIVLPSSPNVTITRRLPLDEMGYIRAEVSGSAGSTTKQDVLSNPIYWTRQVASASAALNGQKVRVAYTVPKDSGAAVFLTHAGVEPWGASDPAIVAREFVAPAQSRGVIEITPPGPGAWQVSVFPANETRELTHYRLPATATLTVPDTSERVSTIQEPNPTTP